MAPGARALVRLRLEQAAALTRGDRFIIRAYSPPVTIGGGVVLDPAPTRPGVRSVEGIASLTALDLDSSRPEAEALSAMVAAAGLAGVHRRCARVARRGGARPEWLPWWGRWQCEVW